jgi:beta-glucosidase
LWNDRLQGLAAANDRLSEVKAVCENSDVIIACMGLDADLEGEEGDQSNEFAGGDKPNLELPGLQQQVLETICSYGKPVVLLLLAGSALAINWADEHIPAIVECWYPGAQGGKSVADILFGAKNPEGKLPVTFYRTSEELPAFTDYNMKGRTYRYMEQEALYPFGYGLSYTEFTYEQVTALKDQVDEEGLIITGNVKNVGAVAGGETVQTYIKINKKGTPNPQLKNILKLHLNPGEEKSFTINIPRDAFGLYDEEGEFQIDSGTATVYVGGQGADARSAALTGKSVISFQVQIL